MKTMKWIKTDSGTSFELKNNDESVLQMSFNFVQKGNPVNCKSSKSIFTILREGFWKSNILIQEQGEVIGKSYVENWYGSNSILEIKGEKFKCKFRNNPLAELAFFSENQNDFLLSYGLKSTNKGHIDVEIYVSQNFDKHPLSDYLLAIGWYIFRPIAQEHTMDFLLLI